MKARCTVCGKEYQVDAEAPAERCISCGGALKPAPTATNNAAPAVVAPAREEGPIELAAESPAAGMTCPNCGKWIGAGAQICTQCGYSRHLARTLTTRVATPETHKPRSTHATGNPDAPEIEAERSYRRAKAHARMGRADSLRLLVALISLLALGATVMAAPTRWLTRIHLQMPPLLRPPGFDLLNAGLMMLLFLIIAVPITALGVRIAAAIMNIETRPYFRWLRTAGAMAATLMLVEIAYSVDQAAVHLETRWLLAALAAVALLVLLLFTWYLHDVNFSAGIVLAFATLIGATVGLLAAALAFAWLGNLLGIGPVIQLRMFPFLHGPIPQFPK